MNRAMGAFCAHDDRLMAIGYVPMRLGPDRAGELMEEGLADGCYSFMVDTNEPDAAARSFTHPDFDPVWSRFEDAAVPFVVHVAVNGEYQAVPRSFANNGSDVVAFGGELDASLLSLVTIKHSAEIFLTATTATWKSCSASRSTDRQRCFRFR